LKLFSRELFFPVS